MSQHRIHIFISHSWKYSGHYNTLSNWIFDKNVSMGQASLNLIDYSVPQDDPIHNTSTDTALKDAIYTQLSLSHVIVIPTGMYANYSKWIQKEIDGANSYNKPILAVNPWGQQRTSCLVTSNANKCVGWNAKSVVDGIWSLYRGN